MSLLYEKLLFDALGRPAFVSPYDQIQIAQQPPANFLFLVSNQWTNGVGLHNQQTVILDPDGEVLVQTDVVEFFLKDLAARHRVDHRMAVTLNKDGRYRIQVLGNDRLALEQFFYVRFRAPITDEAFGGPEG